MSIYKNYDFLSLLLYIALLLFLYPAAAQPQYTVTETELQQLETIYQNLQRNNQTQENQISALNLSLKKAQKQVQLLQTSLKIAQKLQQSLTEQLNLEKRTSKNLQTSFGEYERDQVILLTKKEKKIEHLKSKLYRRTIALMAVTCVLLIAIIIPLVKLYLKGKLKIPFL